MDHCINNSTVTLLVNTERLGHKLEMGEGVEAGLTTQAGWPHNSAFPTPRPH